MDQRIKYGQMVKPKVHKNCNNTAKQKNQYEKIKLRMEKYKQRR